MTWSALLGPMNECLKCRVSSHRTRRDFCKKGAAERPNLSCCRSFWKNSSILFCYFFAIFWLRTERYWIRCVAFILPFQRKQMLGWYIGNHARNIPGSLISLLIIRCKQFLWQSNFQKNVTRKLKSFANLLHLFLDDLLYLESQRSIVFMKFATFEIHGLLWMELPKNCLDEVWHIWHS